MPHIIKYTNVVNNATVLSAGSTASLKVPVFGAKEILFVVRATTGPANPLAAPTAWGFQLQTDTTGFAPPIGVSIETSASATRSPFTSPVVIKMFPTSPNAFINWPFLAVILNGGGAGDAGGIFADCYVLYDSPRVKLDSGQDAFQPA
jgi:hypothetical protein